MSLKSDSELVDFKLFWRACPQNPLSRSCLVYSKGLVTALNSIYPLLPFLQLFCLVNSRISLRQYDNYFFFLIYPFSLTPLKTIHIYVMLTIAYNHPRSSVRSFSLLIITYHLHQLKWPILYSKYHFHSCCTLSASSYNSYIFGVLWTPNYVLQAITPQNDCLTCYVSRRPRGIQEELHVRGALERFPSWL